MTTITKKPLGNLNGVNNTLYTLKNGNTEVDIMNYGATLVSIRTADKKGTIHDVICGYDSLDEYRNNGGYFGAVIGRNSNRIANASFELNGEVYDLFKNDGNNNLHGGKVGFDAKMWAIEENNGALICHYTSPNGECGFPGEADITVTYSLSADNALYIDYKAICDEDTVMNLTNHTYFNLNGHETGSIANHTMKIEADFYTPVDANCCPNGEVLSVKNTVFDFTSPRVIDADIENVPDRDITGGYDHNFILRAKKGELQLAATACGDKSGIVMETYTDKPAIQFYAGNMIPTVKGKGGVQYASRHGFCLETQVCPNCQNQQHLGNAFLKKGEIYRDTTVYKFIAK